MHTGISDSHLVSQKLDFTRIMIDIINLGHTLKSGIRHILNVDRRDNPIFPTEGTLFR